MPQTGAEMACESPGDIRGTQQTALIGMAEGGISTSINDRKPGKPPGPAAGAGLGHVRLAPRRFGPCTLNFYAPEENRSAKAAREANSHYAAR